MVRDDILDGAFVRRLVSERRMSGMLVEVRQSSVFLLTVQLLVNAWNGIPVSPSDPRAGHLLPKASQLDPEVSRFSAKPVDFCSDLGRKGRKLD